MPYTSIELLPLPARLHGLVEPAATLASKTDAARGEPAVQLIHCSELYKRQRLAKVRYYTHRCGFPLRCLAVGCPFPSVRGSFYGTLPAHARSGTRRLRR